MLPPLSPGRGRAEAGVRGADRSRAALRSGGRAGSPPTRRGGRRPGWPRAAAVALLLAACGPAAEPGATVVLDSAGVRVTISRDSEAPFARVDSVPSLSLGGPDVEGPTQFLRVAGVLLHGGRIWVADGGSGELRIFRSDGTHVRSVGGRGEGPGEYRSLRFLGAYGDTVAATDEAAARVDLFDAAGELVRSVRVPDGGPNPRLFEMFGDGTVLGQVPRTLRAADLTPGALLGDSVALVKVDLAEGTRTPWAAGMGPVWLWTGRDQVPIPFTINAAFAVSGDAVHLAEGAAFSVSVFEAGRLTERYGVDRPERVVTGAHEEAFMALADQYPRPEQRRALRDALGHPARPSVLPAYQSLIVSSDGHTWLQIYDPEALAPGVWDVFDGERRLVGRVRTPPAFRLMHVTDTALLGVAYDELGVEYVRVHRLAGGLAPGP